MQLGNDDIPYIKIVNKNIFVEDHTASIDRNEFKEDFLWVDIFCWNWVLHAFIYALIFGVLYLILSLLLFKKDVRYLKEYILK